MKRARRLRGRKRDVDVVQRDCIPAECDRCARRRGADARVHPHAHHALQQRPEFDVPCNRDSRLRGDRRSRVRARLFPRRAARRTASPVARATCESRSAAGASHAAAAIAASATAATRTTARRRGAIVRRRQRASVSSARTVPGSTRAVIVASHGAQPGVPLQRFERDDQRVVAHRRQHDVRATVAPVDARHGGAQVLLQEGAIQVGPRVGWSGLRAWRARARRFPSSSRGRGRGRRHPPRARREAMPCPASAAATAPSTGRRSPPGSPASPRFGARPANGSPSSAKRKRGARETVAASDSHDPPSRMRVPLGEAATSAGTPAPRIRKSSSPIAAGSASARSSVQCPSAYDALFTDPAGNAASAGAARASSGRASSGAGRPWRGAIARNGARRARRAAAGVAAASGATPAVAAATSIPARRATLASRSVPIRPSSRRRGAPAPRRRAPTPAQRARPMLSAAPLARVASPGSGRRSMAPANAAAPAASQCHGVPRDEFDAGFAVPARERGLREWGVDADPQRRGDRRGAPERAPARARPEARHRRRRIGRESAAVRPADEACGIRARARTISSRSPAAARSHSATIRATLGQRRRCAEAATRDDRDANAPVASLRRHRDVMRGVGAGELVLERKCRGAGDARGRHRRQCDRRDAHLRGGEHDLDPVRGGPCGRDDPRPLRTQAPAASKSAHASARSAAGAASSRTRSTVMLDDPRRARIAVVYSTISVQPSPR